MSYITWFHMFLTRAAICSRYPIYSMYMYNMKLMYVNMINLILLKLIYF